METKATAPAGCRNTTTPDGMHWNDDVRLTCNTTADANPVLALNGSGDAGVAWDRSGSVLWKKIDKFGNEIVAEKTLAAGAFPSKPGGFCSPIMGIDSKGCYHVCASPGGTGVYYGKFDIAGDCLVSLKSVPNGAVDPHYPSLAVSYNDIVHLAYDDSRWGYQGISYARLLNDGSLNKDGIRASLAGNSCGPSTMAGDSKGNVHIVYSDVTNGCYYIKLNNQGNFLPEAPLAFLYKDPGATGWPASVACDGFGNVHILWNSAGDGTGMLKYMKLNNNGVTMAAGPDGYGIPLLTSPTCRGFPDIQANGKGDAYAFWSDVGDGLPRIQYLKIEQGTENDTNLPNRAIRLPTTSKATALEPKAAIDSSGLLHVVWKDDRDGNFEIYYKFGQDFRVELTMPPEEMARLLYLRPNETKTANLTVRNTGGSNDTFHINVATNLHEHAGWNVTTYVQEISLAPLQQYRFGIVVKGPRDGINNDFIDTTITATSANDSKKNSSVGFRSYLYMYRAISVRAYVDGQTVRAGVQASYKFRIANFGDYEETIDLEVTGPPWWEFNIDVHQVTLQPFKSAYANLTVTPPSDAQGDSAGVAKVTGATERSPVLTDEFVTRTTVARELTISLAPDVTNATVGPGGTAQYNLTVSEEGNYYVPLNFTFNVTTKTGDWNVSFDPPSVMLKAGSVRYVAMNVTAPPQAAAGMSFEARVECRDGNRTANASCTVTATVREVPCIIYYMIAKNLGLTSGLRTVFDIRLQNTGNAPARLWPGHEDLPPGWQTRLETLNGTVLGSDTPLLVPAGEKWSLRFIVVRPQVNISGTCSVPGSLVDASGNRFGFSADVFVPQFFGIGLESMQEAWADAGGRAPLWLSVYNTGNGPDTVAIICSVLPGWSAEFGTTGNCSLNELRLGPFSEWNESVDVAIPPDCRDLTVNFLFLATSSGGASGTARTIIHIRHADLQLIVSARSSDRPSAGERVTVSLTVRNTGELDARDVIVRMTDGGRIVAERKLGFIGAGTYAVVNLVWNATAGCHSLKMEADPDDAVAETNEADNTVRWQVDVAAAKPASQGKPGMMMPLAALGMAMLAAILILAACGRKRRPPRASRQAPLKIPKGPGSHC